MKRILIGVTYYHPYISGVSVYAKILAEKLMKTNRVEIISAKYKKGLRSEELVNKVKIKQSFWLPNWKRIHDVAIPISKF